MPQNAIAIAFFVFGLLLLTIGIRILIRRRATITLQRSKEVGRPDLVLNLTQGPALLWGTAVLVLGLRIISAYATEWKGGGDLDQISAGGSVTAWAIVALAIAVGWHLLRKARSVYESPEAQQKISEKIQQAMDDKDQD